MAAMEVDDPAAFDLLVRCPTPLSRKQLQVDFRPSYDRQSHPDQQLERSIDKVLPALIHSSIPLSSVGSAQDAKVLLLTDSSRVGGWQDLGEADSISAIPLQLYEVQRFEEGCGEDGVADPAKVVIRLGLTDYKTFIGTNMSPHWSDFLVSSEGTQTDEMSSHDCYGLRSMDVGEFPGYLVFPGGHSEPEEVGIKSHSIRQASTTSELLDVIGAEMFDGIIREIVEETGAAASTLSDPVFLGISRRKQNVRPTAFFYVTCSLSSAEVLKTYKHAEHSFESTVLLSTSPDMLFQEGTKMPGCHRGGAALYQMMCEAQAGATPPFSTPPACANLP